MHILDCSKHSFKIAVFALLNNKVVIYPTETAYALGGNALNRKVVQKIYGIKNRPQEKLFTLIVASLQMAQEFFEFDDRSLLLAEKYWPGAVTLLLFPRVRKGLFALNRKIGVRVSGNQIARALSEGINAPIIATSANLSGAPTCYTKEDICKQFEERRGVSRNALALMPDFLLDAGPLPPVLPSTIISVEEGKIHVIRQGSVVIM